ncbi:MAG: hybrid sensor histidine kinase/response regulator [Chloroflexi bacterium]|nr:hybrid sensor histidine kinase/response regulator [Chloroflexota bacterium]
MYNDSIEILLIEDNPGDSRLIKEMLAEDPGVAYKMEHVTTLSAGMELMERHVFDAVLLDLGLPDSEGLETLKKLRAASPDMPVVVLTGIDDESVGTKAIQEGAQDYLIKGEVDNNLLVRSIRYAIERNRIMIELENTRQEQIGMKNKFFSYVSHELRSPLSGIHGFASILVDGLLGELTPEQKSCLESMLKGLNHMQDILGELLQLSRVEIGGLKVEQKRTGLYDLVKETIDALKPVFDARGVNVTHGRFDEIPDVYADPVRLREILYNLIDNAIKFTPKDGEVKVSAYRDESEPSFVRVEVKDNGRGISPEDHENIFEYLYQEKRGGGGNVGLGIGLFICKELVTLHGGRIWVESEPGKGSIFTFTLPVFSEEADF